MWITQASCGPVHCQTSDCSRAMPYRPCDDCWCGAGRICFAIASATKRYQVSVTSTALTLEDEH